MRALRVRQSRSPVGGAVVRAEGRRVSSMTTITLKVPDALAARWEALPEDDRERLAVEALRDAVASVDAEYLLSLPLLERHRIMAAQAQAAAPLYEADMGSPRRSGS